MREFRICEDKAQLFRCCAEYLVENCRTAVANSGRFLLALSGGNTPRGLYELLATRPYREILPWSKIQLFWVDERCVDPQHVASNYRLTHQTLLGPLQVPSENIHRVRTELGNPSVVAIEYEERIREVFGLRPGQFPRFDTILLGIGLDGHTASLFPNDLALDEKKRLTASTSGGGNIPRITFSLPTINHAAEIAFLVSGPEKAAIVHQTLRGMGKRANLPAHLIEPLDGRLMFFLDRSAAELIQCP